MPEERQQLQPYKISWHPNPKNADMSIQRYVVEKYIPAPGFCFVFEENSVHHVPINHEENTGGIF